MNLNLFKTYVKVVEVQNLSKTAEELSISQPAITKQIQALEEIYGSLLLERSGRRLKTTEAGETLYHYAREIIKLIEKTELAMEDVAESRKGTLFLGASTIPGQYILPQFIKKFKDQHPNTSLAMDIADTEQVFAKVAERELDIGVVGGYINNRKVDGFKWIEDELVVIVPNNHYLNQFKEVSIKDLLNEKWIFREKGSGTRKAIEESLSKFAIKKDNLQILMEAGSTEAVLAMVESEMGISIISKWAINKKESHSKIKSIKLTEPQFKRFFYVIYPKQKSRRKSVANFIEFIKKHKVKKA
ncbi:Transcriptional regulator, LysR family [Candidatus Syntrophocurvum alkaliphilum]|uniref:Transcriptional regulator, LysR family n=1 Tax=Candidatus Syntrophocurvum alkaliphilum TaxID=2293317 RepID=A0A6I6DES9_9FIRM|nr:selenium metabolism-associated LysR family transcriptional regulator [Candidatus Syntrophocurvum alkaliphilum]QGT99028.1 Transcriptional regulator, LysR family [Candidatus Syntrophocurvum alkaliphilum]